MRRALPLLTIALLLLGQAPGEAALDEGPGAIRGEVWDPVADAPAAGVMVSLFRPGRGEQRVYPEPWVREPGEMDQALARVRTDPEGRFVFAGLSPGYYAIKPRGVLQAGGAADVHLTEEEPVRDVRLQVELGGTITGRVTDEDGRPLTDFTVHVTGLDLGDGLNAAHDHQANLHVRTDPEGRYVLSPLPTGTIWLQAASFSFGFSPLLPRAMKSGQRIDGVDLVVPDERGAIGRRSEGAGGVGIRLSFGPEGPGIREVVDGMPAQRAGLTGGEVVLELDGRPTRFMPSTEFWGRCRGPVDSEVTLKVRRADGEVEELTLVRQPFPE